MIAADARGWIFSLEVIGIKLGLSQICALLDALEHPERQFRVITVAGTNGKGSVTAMIERGLRAAGQRTGRYTSPHLVDIEERIAVDGTPITADTFDALAQQVRAAAATLAHAPSFFEATTALALLAFARAGVDVVVLEVGLGGRLDATNAVDASLAVVTPIDFDHQAYLGNTLAAIAAEKAGIIKPGTLVCAAPQPPDARQVLIRKASEMGATLVWAEDAVAVEAEVTPVGSTVRLRTPVASYPAMRLKLPGRHQLGNAVLAVRALELLPNLGWPRIPEGAMATALSDVEWPARLEWRQVGTTHVLIDGAHNPAGARALASFLQEMQLAPVPIVLGVMADKDVTEVVRALAPAASHWVVTAVPSARALAPPLLAEVCLGVTPLTPVTMADDPAAALHIASTLGRQVVVAGSLYLAGHVRARLSTETVA